MHIRFEGITHDNDRNPIEKLVPASMIGLQNMGSSYFVEVYYSITSEYYKAYIVTEKEYKRIMKILETKVK